MPPVHKSIALRIRGRWDGRQLTSAMPVHIGRTSHGAGAAVSAIAATFHDATTREVFGEVEHDFAVAGCQVPGLPRYLRV